MTMQAPTYAAPIALATMRRVFALAAVFVSVVFLTAVAMRFSNGESFTVK
jgi:hypothetical protein